MLLSSDHNRGEEGRRARDGGSSETKRKGQQMSRKFLDKAAHVLRLEGIAEMTVKPQRGPALCQKTGREETLLCPAEREKMHKHVCTILQRHTNINTRETIVYKQTDFLCAPPHFFFFKTSSPTNKVPKQEACLLSTDGASMTEGRKWAEAAAAGDRMGK